MRDPLAEFNQKECLFDLDTSKAYLNEVKSSSQARYSNFYSALKRLNIKVILFFEEGEKNDD
jgi:hypothetical protein